MERVSFKLRVFLLSGSFCCGAVLFVGLLWLHHIKEDSITKALRASEEKLAFAKEILKDREEQWGSPHHMDPLAEWLGMRFGLRVTLITPHGSVVGDSHVPLLELARLGNHLEREEVKEALKGAKGTAVRFSTTMGMELLYMAQTMGPKEAPGLVVRFAIPWDEVNSPLRRAKFLLGLGVGLALVYSLLLSLFLSSLLNREFQRGWKREDRALSAAKSGTEVGEYLQVILDGMREGLLLVNREGRIALVNKTLETLLEGAVAPLGRTPSEVYRQPELQEAIEKCIGEGECGSLELRVSRPRPRTLEVNISAAGKEWVVVIFRDITERKRLEEMRRDWVASASHELRTPVSAIRGYLETLMDGGMKDSAQQRRFLEALHRNCLRLQKILDDLLDLSRLESGPWVREKTTIPLEDLVEGSLELISSAARSKGIVLSHEIKEPKAIIRGDRRQLEQALVNLLENAVNYTDPGGEVRVKGWAEAGEVYISVEDTGIGIPPEHIPRIFERFYRVDKDRSRQTGGTGLGLSIVKHVVQNHGGRIEVQSTPGKGSTFTLIFPSSSLSG